ncbi:MAG TPA: c-type cytochrome [Capsulimonadaceae bacterium]|nr:c-type cytochrome [Capsulimonadaceae bacterium]
MNRLLPIFLLLSCSLGVRAAGLSADSARGEQVFERLACVQCHSVNGKGGNFAPDLGRMVDRGFTPATLAATMWNHAPGMWEAMRAREISAGELDEQAAEDLMAFFYSARFFEKPGDAGRGKRAFENRGCQSCHSLSGGAKAKPANDWEGLSDPIALVEAMWNHRAEMQAANASQGAPPPQITAQELTDMLVYLRNLPGNRGKPGVFRTAPAGEAVFESAGCAKCHKTLDALAQNVQGQTLTDIAAEMWNHAPRMAAAGAGSAPLAPGQMRDLVSALWAARFFAASGRPAAGSRVFAAKNCAVCHNDAASGAPHLPIAGRDFSGATMVSVLWRHGPRMLDRMKSKNLAWPRFDGSQMADLIAYLNSEKPGQSIPK